MEQWHEKPMNIIMEELGATEKGLTEKDAMARLVQFGRNVIPEKRKESNLSKFLQQFRQFLVIILIAAAVVSFAIGEYLDGAAIIAIVVLNAFLGFIQERKAEKALEALKKLAALKSKVLRDGGVKIVSSEEIVPGDIVLLESGDKVPADCRIIELNNLRVDESVLTGESTPVDKTSDVLKGDLAVADRRNMLLSGTTVVYGRCKALVVGTGASTELGKIAKSLQDADDITPLQKKLGVLGRQLGVIIIAVCLIVFAVGLFHGIELLDIFLTSVSLAVAAIPEGLPAIVTITLAIGLTRLVKKNSIIRKLPAAETLGSTTVICSDKTGTLTKNQMTVRRLYVSGRVFEVSGEGYDAKGEITLNGKKVEENNDILTLLTVGMMCNNASLKDSTAIGDPTEIALLVSGVKYGISDPRQFASLVKEIEFDSSRRMMSVIYSVDGKKIMYTKGAVEEVLKRCTRIYSNGRIEEISERDKKKILDANKEFAGNALRVLAFAMKKALNEKEDDLIFVGLQGMIDPPRPEVRDSINTCRLAGIRVVMITGDHRDTAFAIAKELGIAEDEKEVITGEQMDKMRDGPFEDAVDSISVYARVSPEHKVRITDALKKKGHIVAMTGDGVNDAPALKKADIGIAVGSGTDVAKEASDMILTDDNFASIVSAVEEGRGIYDNIKKFTLYLLSCNIAEVLVVFMAMMFVKDPSTGLFILPLLPLQLLWLNIATDGLPAIALGMEPYDPDIMKRKPRDPKENVLDARSIRFMLSVGILITAMTLYLFVAKLPNADEARTMAFTSLVVLEMFVALSFRSHRYLFTRRAMENKKLLLAIVGSLAIQAAIVYVPFLNSVFGTVPLQLFDWVYIVCMGLLLLAVIEVAKLLNIQEAVRFTRREVRKA